MTPEEEAYEEALRRIREAEETGALKLDLLILFGELRDVLTPLAGLTSLKELNILFEKHVSDFSPLGGLTSLQSLNLGGRCSALTAASAATCPRSRASPRSRRSTSTVASSSAAT